MKEIKAYLHRHQISEVIRALKESGEWTAQQGSPCRNVAVYRVQGSLEPMNVQEEHYSMNLAEMVTFEYKLELACEDDEVDRLVQLVRDTASTGRSQSGWIFVVDIERSVVVS